MINVCPTLIYVLGEWERGGGVLLSVKILQLRIRTKTPFSPQDIFYKNRFCYSVKRRYWSYIICILEGCFKKCLVLLLKAFKIIKKIKIIFIRIRRKCQWLIFISGVKSPIRLLQLVTDTVLNSYFMCWFLFSLKCEQKYNVSSCTAELWLCNLLCFNKHSSNVNLHWEIWILMINYDF